MINEAPVTALGDLIALGDGGPLPASGRTLAHRRFEAVASVSPDVVAVVTKGETLTYGELDARAQALAVELRAHDIARECVVAICLPRRLDVLVAILATLKAGGAYLPLDIAQPKER